MGDQDKNWAPHICCNRCRTSLLFWLDGKRKQMPFAVPMIWREQNDHISDCYFCMTNIAGFSRKSKSKIAYLTCKSAPKPVPHGSDIPVPIPPSKDEEYASSDGDESASADENTDVEMDPSFADQSGPLLINQERLNDLVRDRALSKEKAEVLGSRLQQWNLLESGTTISSFRHRNKTLARYYAIDDDICYCKDVNSLMTELGYKHHLAEWRLFIDSSKLSLKAVLLHNGNSKPSIPVGHSTKRKETCDTMEILLKLLNYSTYNWKVCGDLKVISPVRVTTGIYKAHVLFMSLG